ncbi:MAG: succinate--CoA ligase subunit alpha [Synergistales bacterium]|uniref:succinate--CoA ligase subunit alpha n=1 Tax=Aminivibrio sp. TaxID=1872489 RepID=UPI001DA5DA02|nr:succinate--CoA ligase subunit alpha [Synergistaceae bacterium]MDD4020881.1 succinate--CoA ligase subunit alpha [Synergistaceae bacterium]MDD4611870.1 succinate--CoA ligase subunit alpha [Synergistaceae bacterium]NCC56237.1 succinate--CoA ligase subunit alpha [Synergistales bacterium]
MAVLVDRNTRVIVQGITGKSGILQTKSLIDYGTAVVAGVTPGKAGTAVEGVPVFNSVADAMKETDPNAAISFVPPMFAKDAAMEAMEAGIKLLVLTMEGIPKHDVLDILSYASGRGVCVLGPGTAGVISPGKCKLGAHPARMFREGRVGVVSKSGALSYEVGKTLTDAGIGQSTVVALGGGPIWGTTQRDVVELFNADPETEIIVLLGEIGGSTEIAAAEYIAESVRKPVVSLIVGRSAPEGKSLGHAGAIIRGNKGTAASKMEALEKAGALLATTPAQVVELIRKLG